jgi:hypothetical protein
VGVIAYDQRCVNKTNEYGCRQSKSQTKPETCKDYRKEEELAMQEMKAIL